MKEILSQAEKEAVQQSVKAAEERTSGEIVPYVVSRSDRYEVAYWRGAALVVGLALVAALLIHGFYEGWGLGWVFTGIGMATLVVAAAALGVLAVWLIPPVLRFFAGHRLMTRRVHQRAMQAFVDEEVFKTQDRTGILLFVSILEHRIEVVGDEGIYRKVEDDDWVEVVETIREGIERKQLGDGLVAGIGLCGELLDRKGVEIKPDDVDELSDSVRVHRR
jgi:putative membrane protein